uniref:Secreted protein n=1 Tax=Steinernema glaseri TaxID=37863 RepID=A0A1I7Y0K8_9BILA
MNHKNHKTVRLGKLLHSDRRRPPPSVFLLLVVLGVPPAGIVSTRHTVHRGGAIANRFAPSGRRLLLHALLPSSQLFIRADGNR